MAKIKVGLSALMYPVTMARYFWDALERREDVEVYSIGPFFGDWIPWSGGINLPRKYVKTPSVPLPREMASHHIPFAVVANTLPDDLDLFLTIDAGWHFSTRPNAKVVALVKTDPHAISREHYDAAARYSDIVFGMQTPYLLPGERYLPYAFDPNIHYPMDLPKEYDTCLIGLQYEQRMRLVDALRAKGISVKSGIGVVYDDYRVAYNHARVALSWSSLQDTPTRVYEAFGMGLSLVSNRTPDLCAQFVEGDHFLGFDTVKEAVEKVQWCLSHPIEAEEMANAAYRKALVSCTWDHRIETIFEVCGLNKKVRMPA